MPDLYTLGSITLTCIALAYAIYQGTERRKLERLNRSEAWVLYSNTVQVFAAIQLQKEPPNVRAEQAARDLCLDCVRLIQRSEPRFDLDRIAEWVQQGKVQEDLQWMFRDISIG